MALNNHVENFTLDMAPGGIAPVLNVSQGDTGRAYTADMYWGGASYDVSGLTVRLRGRKRDNTVFDYALPAPSGTKVAFDLKDKEQVAIIPGNVECELVFTDSNSRVVGTANFVIIVEESPYDPNAISESEVTGLVDLISDQIGGAVDDWMETEAPTSPEFAAAMQTATDTYLDENGVVINYDDIIGTEPIDALLNKTVCTCTWEQGGIDINNGRDADGTTRIRTSNYIDAAYPIEVSFPSNFKISYRVYDANGTFVSSSDWINGGLYLGPQSGQKYRLVVAYTNNATITPDAAADVVVNAFEYTDETLSVGGRPADAKVTGDYLDKVNGDVLALTGVKDFSFEWEQGNLYTSDGSPMGTDSNRIRTTDYFTKDYPVKIIFPETMSISYREFDANGNFVFSSDWITVPTIFSFENGKKYKFTARYNSNADLSPSDGSDIFGEACSDITEVIGTNEKHLAWEEGTISTDGSIGVNATRVRTQGYIDAISLITFEIPQGLKVSFRKYDNEYNYLTYSDWNTEAIELQAGYKYRLVAAFTNNANIMPSDVANEIVETFYQLHAVVDNMPIPAEITKTNSVLGNISIRAAKTIQFSDGTPPFIDWYLIHNISGDFYRTKDFETKEYLFSFSPPSGKLADWSAGITANNDILFVADAAGLSDSNGRLNDANRINPVCFLASENYSTMHTIDFGTAKKPCGWLENVGFCVLPNGNIVFCEYTRGTVKTANVWLVDTSDITDATNWTVTWSHDIVDLEADSNNGMKHCHEVQFDFFTGIVYFGTGDSDAGSWTYYSTDNGATWTLLFGPNKKKCRRLNYAFTKNKVYWASDSYESFFHSFFIAERDTNGVIDIANATEVSLADAYSGINYQACYGVVYIAELGAVVMMDRMDVVGSDTLHWFCYDIATNSIKKIGEIKSVNNATNVNLGFRCKFVEWYPKDNCILVGFNPVKGSLASDTNVAALCGNEGGTTGTGATRVNNLALYINRLSDGNYSYRAGTKYC